MRACVCLSIIIPPCLFCFLVYFLRIQHIVSKYVSSNNRPPEVSLFISVNLPNVWHSLKENEKFTQKKKKVVNIYPRADRKSGEALWSKNISGASQQHNVTTLTETTEVDGDQF